jgi:putative addiction module killer protein/probable addiction module antidote protein
VNRPTFPRRVDRYKRKSGEVPFDLWLHSLRDATIKAVIITRLERVEKGLFGDHESVGKGVFELKFDYGPGYRVYYGLNDNGRLVLLLGGGSKSKQQKDIQMAQILWKEYYRGFKMKNALPLKELVLEQLRDPEFAAAYLNEHMKYRGKFKKELLLEGIMNIIEVYGTTQMSKTSKVSRRALYKSFSEDGNPTLETLLAVFDQIGITFKFGAKKTG